jgi:hypothetical protein
VGRGIDTGNDSNDDDDDDDGEIWLVYDTNVNRDPWSWSWSYCKRADQEITTFDLSTTTSRSNSYSFGLAGFSICYAWWCSSGVPTTRSYQKSPYCEMSKAGLIFYVSRCRLNTPFYNVYA